LRNGQKTYSRFLAFVALLTCAVLTLRAHAEAGPCKPLEHTEVLICGSGDGAAIVIGDTTSPSGKLALGWRATDGPPTEQPDEDSIELLILRLADGAALYHAKGSYWDTGEMHVNRLQEKAAWSPNSRFMVRAFHSRFSTDDVDVFALGADDKVTGPFDLLKLLDSTARAKLKERVKDTDGYEFFLAGMKDDDKPVTVDNAGNIVAHVMFWIPKNGPFYYYTVKARTREVNGALDVRIVSIAYRGKQDE